MRAESRSTVFLIGLLTLIPPLAIDFHLPAMPRMTEDLGTTDSAALMTVSACFLGFCIGQLVIGSLSDRVGRRMPLLVGTVAFSLSSFACMLAPSVELLLALRTLQGIAGSAALVIARAIVRDLFTGIEAARVFSALGAITVIAPILGPPLGGLLLLWTDWRGVFAALGIAGIALAAMVWIWIPDTLRVEHRTTGGAAGQFRQYAAVLSRSPFLAVVLANGFAALSLFMYVSMGSHVLQNEYGLSAQGYSLVFAGGALGMLVATQVNRVLLTRGVAVRTLVTLTVSAAVVGSVLVALAALAHAPRWVLIGAVVIAVMPHGATVANMFSIGLSPFARGAGTASALLGSLQFAFGGIVPPIIAALAGADAIVMGVTMASTTVVALAILVVWVRPRPAAR